MKRAAVNMYNPIPDIIIRSKGQRSRYVHDTFPGSQPLLFHKDSQCDLTNDCCTDTNPADEASCYKYELSHS